MKPVKPAANGNPTNFFSNLRGEMELFHSQLSSGEGLEIFVLCFNGAEISIERIIPLPPDMLVFECRNGDRIVQHINSVQLRFHKTFSNTEFMPLEKVPIGFRTLEGEEREGDAQEQAS